MPALEACTVPMQGFRDGRRQPKFCVMSRDVSRQSQICRTRRAPLALSLINPSALCRISASSSREKSFIQSSVALSVDKDDTCEDV
jgi:hypothetical protein